MVSPPVKSAEERVATLLPAYKALRDLGLKFYPIHPDKSPAVSGKLSLATTADPTTICYWLDHRHHWGIACRIGPGIRLLVIDTEHPLKHSDRVGPDGETVLADIVATHDIVLPECPLVRTPTDGYHRYFRVPRGYRIRGTVAMWPGVDILAQGSNVILPGSKTTRGTYEMVRGFDGGIPEAPAQFVQIIRQRQTRTKTQHPKISKAGVNLISDPAGGSVELRIWCRLSRNPLFRQLWQGEKQTGDVSPSSYEFHLAKVCFCNGLTRDQTMNVLTAWRRRHGLKTDASYLKKILQYILPKAWEEVHNWVLAWKKQRAIEHGQREEAKTKTRILNLIATHGPQTPQSAKTVLAMPLERIKKCMQRLAQAGKIHRTREGYSLMKPAVANCKPGRRLSALTVEVLRLAAETPGRPIGEIAVLTGASRKAVAIILQRHGKTQN